jgi:hypothetical protein
MATDFANVANCTLLTLVPVQHGGALNLSLEWPLLCV